MEGSAVRGRGVNATSCVGAHLWDVEGADEALGDGDDGLWGLDGHDGAGTGDVAGGDGGAGLRRREER